MSALNGKDGGNKKMQAAKHRMHTWDNVLNVFVSDDPGGGERVACLPQSLYPTVV